jgi:hypothetical protein
MWRIYSNPDPHRITESRCSEPFLVTRGVKQGDNLSPTLFNIFNDIYSQLQNSNTHPLELQIVEVGHLLFANDLKGHTLSSPPKIVISAFSKYGINIMFF